VFLLIYNIAIRLYGVAVRIASWWNPKAKLLVDGRADLDEKLYSEMNGNTRPVIWMHCASLGEFEQGRYLLENLRITYPDCCIVISFFSPSGYEIMKNYSGADHIFYLPLPTKENSRKFIELVNPKLVLWIKYEYWYHFLSELNKRNVPVLLISAIFLREYVFFRWYGPLYKKMLMFFRWIFVQNPESEKRLKSIGFGKNVSVNGDTRFDRVVDIASNFTELPGIAEFCGDHKTIVAGSTWEADEEELDHFANLHTENRFIIAPHEVDEQHLKDIEKLFRNSIRYSVYIRSPDQHAGKHIMLIDNIGMLSRLYKYATVVYVGGGFGDDGIHNVLEAAVYGRPVIFGPVFNRFSEAIGLLEEGGAFTVDNALELESKLNELLENPKLYQESGAAAKKYVNDNTGATGNIMRFIQENRLLTN